MCGNLLLGVEPCCLGVHVLEMASGVEIREMADFANSCICWELASVAVVEDVLFRPTATNDR